MWTVIRARDSTVGSDAPTPDTGAVIETASGPDLGRGSDRHSDEQQANHYGQGNQFQRPSWTVRGDPPWACRQIGPTTGDPTPLLLPLGVEHIVTLDELGVRAALAGSPGPKVNAVATPNCPSPGIALAKASAHLSISSSAAVAGFGGLDAPSHRIPVARNSSPQTGQTVTGSGWPPTVPSAGAGARCPAFHTGGSGARHGAAGLSWSWGPPHWALALPPCPKVGWLGVN